MTLRPHTIIALLLLGIITNILVAWMCEAWSSTECVDLSGKAVLTRRPTGVEGTWTSATAIQEARGLGRTTIWFLATGVGDVCLHRAGWPLRSLQYQYDEGLGARRSALGCGQLRWAVLIPDRPIVPRRLAGKPLPVLPLAAGFIVNSMLYALVFLPLAGGLAGFIRARFRRMRGLCPACGYPIGISAVCTECGRPVVANAPPTAKPGENPATPAESPVSPHDRRA